MIMDSLNVNASKFEQDIEDVISRLVKEDFTLQHTWDIDNCDESMLPWLAWAYSVDTWDAQGWNTEQKRKVIHNSIRAHKVKGTKGAIYDAINALGYIPRIPEWYEGGSVNKPVNFDIEVTILPNDASRNATKKIQHIIESNKNIRSIAKLIVIQPTLTKYHVGAATTDGMITTIYPKASV